MSDPIISQRDVNSCPNDYFDRMTISIIFSIKNIVEITELVSEGLSARRSSFVLMARGSPQLNAKKVQFALPKLAFMMSHNERQLI